MTINFSEIEKKWQDRWEKKKVFVVSINKRKKKFYCLEMFPYPSASFLHMGHVRNYAIGDAIARFKRMNGFNVLYPIGFDSFGLPAENAAKKMGKHPKEYTEYAIKKITSFLKKLGNSYDWTKVIETHKPEYYKWNQYFFLKFYEKGLVYRKKAPVNWCPSCRTVLANEEVENGKCWRCESEVETKYLDQWFFKTTAYADELIKGLKKLQWSNKIKIIQKNWIGKSRGTIINFKINGNIWPVFTTRPDTIFGVTFMVISANHPRLMEIVTKEKKKEIEEFVKKCKSMEKDELEKEGVFTGSYALHPITNEKIPVYAGNFVIADYGCGMVMAVPAHDQRDFEFAKKYKLPIKVVIQGSKKIDPQKMEQAFVSEGVLINSGEFNGLSNKEAMEKITTYLEKNGLGKKTVQYKLRDWLISRQRYWGTPIPIIYCKKCGTVPVPENDLPVLLPEDVVFEKTNPMLTSKKFRNIKCPKCGNPAKRETDTMGGFMDSSWYFLRYCDNKNEKKPFDKNKVNYWMPVDQYIGGIEHAVGHLIYSRFFTKALRDMNMIDIDEPFIRLFNQGIVYKDGRKMSKSHGNTITQDEISKKYGIDTARLFLLFVASPESSMEWSDEGIEGVFRFVKKLFLLKPKAKQTEKSEHYRNKYIKLITEDIENFRFNLAIIKLMEWCNMLSKECDKKSYEDFVKMLSVFAPHIAEELWELSGKKGFVSIEKWPLSDKKKIKPIIEQREEFLSYTINDIKNIMQIAKIKKPKKVLVFVAEKWKFKALKKILDGAKLNDLMKSELKQYGQEVVKFFKIFKEKTREIKYILPKDEQLKILNDLKKCFDFSIEVIDADKSNEKKAKASSPIKPGILVL